MTTQQGNVGLPKNWSVAVNVRCTQNYDAASFNQLLNTRQPLPAIICFDVPCVNIADVGTKSLAIAGHPVTHPTQAQNADALPVKLFAPKKIPVPAASGYMRKSATVVAQKCQDQAKGVFWCRTYGFQKSLLATQTDHLDTARCKGAFIQMCVPRGGATHVAQQWGLRQKSSI